MKKPKISVVTVCYNSATFMEESILSVVNQTYDNIEYIIIDGRSTDGTLKLLEKYKEYITFLISEQDKGIYDAMNKALKIATGDFLLFLGADDHFLSYKTLEKVAKKLNSDDCIYYGSVYFESYNLLHKGKFSKFKRAVFNYCHQSIFYPRKAYKKYSYDLRFRLYADNYYNFIVSNEFPFEYINETIAFYAKGGASSHKNDMEWAKVKEQMILRYCGVLPYLYMKLRSLILR